MTAPASRAGYIALVGAPNVGKSTLLNALLGTKLSIVAPKPQTTRQRVLGIFTRPGVQIVFLDTPGLIDPKYLLHKRMVGHAFAAAADADCVAVVTDVAAGSVLPEEVEQVLAKVPPAKPAVLIINKVDTVARQAVLPHIAAFSARGTFRDIIPVSALKRENLGDLEATLVRYLPEQPPFYPDDILSEHPERFFASEFVREQIIAQFHDEVPYSTAVEIREFKERAVGKEFIAADIIVERESQKAIIIGRGGVALKRVGERARRQIESFLGRPVFLELHVRVREGWRSDDRALNQFGYTSPEPSSST